MKKYKVIFDTNSVLSTSMNVFLRKGKELLKFEEQCEIIIPDIVIGEIKRQKYEKFVSDKNKITKAYKNLAPDSSASLELVEFEEKFLEAKGNETINYKVISLTEKEDALTQMVELALQKSPPFASTSDAGFKDAYIYFTILEYAKSQSDKTIFVITGDGRLREALESDELPRIKVLKDHKEFEVYIAEQYQDVHSMTKIRNHFDDQSITSQDLEMCKNIEGNDILRVKSKGEEFVLIMIDKCIHEVVPFLDVQNAKNSLINSGTFLRTHRAIVQLKNYVQYLSDDDIREILNACLHENEQISSIATDPDVKQFILDLSANKQHLLDDWTKDFIEGL